VDLWSMLERQRLNTGFGDAMARGFEIVCTPFLFGLFGWWLDGKTGTRPLFALTFGIFVLGYELWKVSRGYMTAMDAETRKVLKKND
jgi:F0F1-type ATP synthase assembly protein I